MMVRQTFRTFRCCGDGGLGGREGDGTGLEILRSRVKRGWRRRRRSCLFPTEEASVKSPTIHRVAAVLLSNYQGWFSSYGLMATMASA